jgi:hypothetical protein
MNGQFQVYKKNGAMQVSLLPYDSEQYKGGAVFLQAAPCVNPGDKVYDWKNGKIVFALGINDICLMFDNISGTPKEFSLVHVPPGQEDSTKFKKLSFKPGEGSYAGTWMLRFEDRNTQRQCTVPLSRGEFMVFMRLVEASLPAVVGFDTSSLRSFKTQE